MKRDANDCTRSNLLPTFGMHEMNTRTITAVYDSEADARSARDRLLSGGLDEEDVRIISHSLARSNGGGGSPADKSFWESVADFVVVEEDRPLYSETLRRGGYVLTALVDEEVSDEAISMLEDTHPVDLDERSQRWRDEGWSPEGLGTPASMHGYAPGTGPTTEAVAHELRRGSQALAERSERADETDEVRIWIREAGRGTVRVRSYVIQRGRRNGSPRDDRQDQD